SGCPERALVSPAAPQSRHGLQVGIASDASATASERALHVALGVTLGDVAALVALLLAAGDGQLELRAAVLEVQARRYERQALLLYLADQRFDLAPVQEQLPVAVGLVVGDVPLLVLVDVGADQPHLAVTQVGVGLRERDPPVAERLDLRAG